MLHYDRLAVVAATSQALVETVLCAWTLPLLPTEQLSAAGAYTLLAGATPRVGADHWAAGHGQVNPCLQLGERA